MTENRFRVFKFPDVNKFGVSDDIVEVTVAFCDKKWEADYLCDLLNELHEENKRLKIKNRGLLSELQIFKEDVEYSNKICNKLSEENKELKEENEQLKQFNNEAIGLILDGVVEMHDGKRDYAESIFNKAIKLLKGDVE